MSDWWRSDPVDKSSWWHSDPIDKTDYATDVAKGAGSGIVEGTLGAAVAGPMLINTLAKGVQKAAEYLAPESAFTKSMQEGSRQAAENVAAIKKARGEQFYEYEPKTEPGKIAQRAAGFVPAAATGPGGIVARFATQAVVPAAASEVAGQLTKGTKLEPWARVGGAVIGGGVGSKFNVPRTVEGKLAEQLPEYVKQSHINEAEQLIREAASRRVMLSWPEALSSVTGRPVLTDMQRLLESAPQTRAEMQKQFAFRPIEMDRAAIEELKNIAPGTAQPSMIGREAGREAQGVVQGVKGVINTDTRPFYQAAENVLLTNAEMNQVRAIPGYDKARAAVRNSDRNRNVAHLPDDSVGFLNEVKKYFDEARINARRGPESSQVLAGHHAADAAAVKNVLVNASPHYDIALQAQAAARREHLDPLLAGPIGQLAKKDVTTQKAINALFPDNPLPGSHSEIQMAVGALAKRNPGVAAQLVRAHVESELNRASKMLESGFNQFGIAKWASNIAGNPQQFDNLKAAVHALPDGAARWQSFEKFLDIARATGTRQAIGSKTAFNDLELSKMRESGKFLSVGKIAASPAKWLTAAYDYISAWQQGKNLNALARVITDPRAGDLFRQIAASRTPRQAQILAARLVALTGIATRQP